MVSDVVRKRQPDSVCVDVLPTALSKHVFSTESLADKSEKSHCMKTGDHGTSLVVQWLRIRLLMRRHGFEPWSRKIPRATEQLSP